MLIFSYIIRFNPYISSILYEKSSLSPTSELFTKIFPPWKDSIIRSTKDKPSPQPRFLVVYPGLKTVLNFDFGIPFPVSAKSISTTFSLSSTFSEISPLPSMASTAFFVRFSITQANRESFIKTNIGPLRQTRINFHLRGNTGLHISQSRTDGFHDICRNRIWI